jgi:glycosyltransferase involved in cell wall biosynthesis
MKILLISSVLPRDTTAGEVILYRHLTQWSKLNLTIATDNSQDLLSENIVEIQANQFLNRLTQTRMARLAHIIRQCFESFYDSHELRQHIKHNKPDLILTVAHGELCWLAQQMSQEYSIPLATFFHDWWPDLAYIHYWARRILEYRFKRLYQHSQLALCISEAMRRTLGSHPHAQVLFPIPEKLALKKYSEAGVRKEGFKVIYAGNISGIYRPMLQSLCQICLEVSEFQLKLFGPQPDWSSFLVEDYKKNELYGGFVSREVLMTELNYAHALLLTMSFETRDKRRTQISLPSKLLDYCQFGKPIIIWGPGYCSAIQWGLQYQSALVVTSPYAKDLVQAIRELATQPEKQNYFGNKALDMAHSIFNPEKIQQQFVDSLTRLL